MELPKEVERLMALAVSEAIKVSAEAVEPLHLFIAICKQGTAAVTEAFAAEGVTDLMGLRRRVRAFAREVCVKRDGGPQRVSGRVLNIIDQARLKAIYANRTPATICVLIALLEHPDTDLKRVMERENLLTDSLIKHLEEKVLSVGVNKGQADEEPAPVPDTRRSPTPTLDRYSKDYTALAREGKLEPIIGRREEIKQLARILLQKQKNNPVLVGDAGVGKTAIVEGLAQRAASQSTREELQKMRIIEVIISSLIAGTKYRGEFEERLQLIIEETEANPNIVLFFDEIHTLVGAGAGGGSLDAANILKPALARGRMRCIGATTFSEYRQYIEKDAALERRFQPIRVEEPTREEAREILLGLRESYEAHHKVEITDEAIDAAVDLSIRYLPDRRLPDKARDLIDQAAVRKRFGSFSTKEAGSTSDQKVMREDVAQVIAGWTGVPVERLSADQQTQLLQIEDALRQRVIGQEEAIKAVANVVRTAFAKLSNPSRPLGVLLFMGPTGVGKTETAKALAEFLFGDEKRLLRFDMSEYMEEHSVSKLTGAPPGYVGYDVGGTLTNAVRKAPYSILLFDEVEKAHPRISDIFLQIFDDGRLTDAQGRTADFRNTVIILTTNLGPEKGRKPVRGFRPDKDEGEEIDAAQRNELSPDEARKILLSGFRPELVNRISQIVQFHPLGEPEMQTIIEKIVSRVQKSLIDKNIELRLSNPAYKVLISIGYKPEWGAREIERVVEQFIIQPLAQGLLDDSFKSGDVIYVVPEDGGVKLTTGTPQQNKLDVTSAGQILLTTMASAAREKVAMLLVDIVKSTEIIQREGDTALMNRVRRINDSIISHPLSSKMRFLKFTGDGFLIVYSDVATALQIASALSGATRDGTTCLRLIIHYSSVKIDFGGDPIGAEVHRLFRIEALDDAQCVVRGPSGRRLPEHSYAVITPAALQELPEETRARFELLGQFRLKGFEEPEEIWAEKKRE